VTVAPSRIVGQHATHARRRTTATTCRCVATIHRQAASRGYDAGVRLTDWEQQRLLVFTAAELARRHRAAGLKLNAPEAIALICDAMFEAARAGATYEEVEAAGRAAVAADVVMDGVPALVDEVRLEVLLGDGTRVIVLVDPLGSGRSTEGTDEQPAPTPTLADRQTIDLKVTNTSRRPIRVSSHFPFEQVNRRLEFDRAAAGGFRLDLPAGATERWAPGESRTVRLVRRR
jgi:urease subunit gamma/beta